MKKTLLSLVVIGSFIAPLAALENNEACQKEDRFHSYYLPRIKVAAGVAGVAVACYVIYHANGEYSAAKKILTETIKKDAPVLHQLEASRHTPAGKIQQIEGEIKAAERNKWSIFRKFAAQSVISAVLCAGSAVLASQGFKNCFR
jgi:hypothetical protein